jgi:hypothetical protein
MRQRGFLAAALGTVAGVMLITGCATKATGGGWIHSLTATEKATFGFSWDATDCANPLVTTCTVRFNGSYHDPAATINGATLDVRLKGAGKLARVVGTRPPIIPDDPAISNCMYDPAALYESQDPNRPGTGFLQLHVCDYEQGNRTVDLGDYIAISVDTGPYLGYQNFDFVQGGNIQASS